MVKHLAATVVSENAGDAAGAVVLQVRGVEAAVGARHEPGDVHLHEVALGVAKDAADKGIAGQDVPHLRRGGTYRVSSIQQGEKGRT